MGRSWFRMNLYMISSSHHGRSGDWIPLFYDSYWIWIGMKFRRCWTKHVRILRTEVLHWKQWFLPKRMLDFRNINRNLRGSTCRTGLFAAIPIAWRPTFWAISRKLMTEISNVPTVFTVRATILGQVV